MKKKFDKKEFKRKTLKTINVICYILSGLFLLLCVVAGCKSCKKSDNSRLENSKMQLNVNNVNYQYTLLNNPNFDSGDYNVGNSQFNWVDYYFDNAVHSEQLGNQEIYLNDFGYYYDDYGSPLKIGFVRLKFTEIKIGNIYRFYFETLDVEYDYFANGGGTETDFIPLIWNSNDYDVYYFNNDDFVFDLYAITQYNCPILNYFYYFDIQTQFTFNNQINYNANNGGTLDNKYLSSISYDTIIVSTIYRKIYNTGLFISNNKLYDAIVVDYQSTNGLIFVDDNGRKFTTSGGYSYFALGYRINGSNTIDFVNYRDTKTFYNSTDGDFTATINSSTWLNQNYRYLTFMQNLTQENRTKIENFNNNGLNTGSGYSGDLGDVFDLLSNAFVGIIPFLSVMILPGISLGILLFIPLVVIIIFAIIRIMHK